MVSRKLAYVCVGGWELKNGWLISFRSDLPIQCLISGCAHVCVYGMQGFKGYINQGIFPFMNVFISSPPAEI